MNLYEVRIFMLIGFNSIKGTIKTCLCFRRCGSDKDVSIP